MITNYSELKRQAKLERFIPERNIIRHNLEYYLKINGLKYLLSAISPRFLYADIVIGWYILLGENEKGEEIWMNLNTKNIFKGKVYKT